MGNRRQPPVGNTPTDPKVTDTLICFLLNSRENAADILKEYFKGIGGREKIFEQTSSALKGRKRGRQSNSATPAEKRSRKNGHPADSTPPATARAVEWKPPSGSWDEEVDTVDMCQDEENGTFIVYLTWKNGKKTQHPKEVVYRRCPQKVGPHEQAGRVAYGNSGARADLCSW
jgi:chromobox protein 1